MRWRRVGKKKGVRFGPKELVRLFPRFLLLLLCVAWPMILENWDGVWEFFNLKTFSCSMQQQEAPASFNFASAYKTIFALRHARPAVNRVRILTLDANLPGVRRDLCQGRALMADVLNTLSRMQPAAVALDKYYGPESCTEGDAGTLALQKSVQAFPLPLVIGQATAATETPDKLACECTMPALPLQGANAHPGYVRFDDEVLQIPLRRVVRQEDRVDADYVPEEQSYGIAFATAVAMEPRLAKTLAYSLKQNHQVRPYADLWSEAELRKQSVSEFLCGAAPGDVKTRWGLRCKGSAPLDVRGSAVVIGAEDLGDVKEVLGEPMLGFEVNARYIAALLGGAYLQEWALWAQLLWAAPLLIGTEALLLFFNINDSIALPRFLLDGFKSRTLSVLSAVSIICLATIGGCLAPLHFGYFPPLGLIATTVLLWANDFRMFVVERVKGVVAIEA